MFSLLALIKDCCAPDIAPVRVIDGFTFYNEVDMLELRLRYFYPLVDEFIIVEADTKFNGDSKPLLLQDLMQTPRFSWAADKVSIRSLHVDVSDFDFTKRPEKFDASADSWKIEAQQRNAIRPARMAPGDILLMGDLDEFPSPDFINAIRRSRWLRARLNWRPFVCEQKFFYYNYKSLRTEVWPGTIAMGVRSAAAQSNQAWRNRRKKLPGWHPGGWHFSYFMNAEQIADKIRSFSHQELNTEYMRDTDRIQSVISQKKDLFGREGGIVEFSGEDFPERLQLLLKQFFPC